MSDLNEKRKFYVGIRPCGCITACLVDDQDTQPGEIAEFARDMKKTGRRVEHREMSYAEFQSTFKSCEHKKAASAA